MDKNVRNMILDYEKILPENSTKKIPVNYFRYNDEQNEKMALELFRYVFENVLHWTPLEAFNNMSKEFINKMHLVMPYNKLRFPRELNKNHDYFYVVKMLYPDQFGNQYNEKDLIITMYKAVQEKKSGKFPKEYFVENAGILRACVCLQYLLQQYIFDSINDIYELFANDKKADEFLKEHCLYSARKTLYECPLDYLHAALQTSQKSDLLYNYYRFYREFKKKKMEKNVKEKYIVEAC